MIESNDGFTRDDFRDMQQDCLSLRGLSCVPGLLAALRTGSIPAVRAAADLLRDWDGSTTPDSAATTIFNVFFTSWARRVADERFAPETAELVVKGVEGAAARLLSSDAAGWFAKSDREEAIRETFAKTVSYLAERFGNNPREWIWGRLHTMPLKHVLSARGDLGKLLDHGGAAVRGDMVTVCNTGAGPDWTAVSGAGYRHIAELGSKPPVLWAVDGQGESGNPGSPHYSDQFDDWASGRYHRMVLDRDPESNPPEAVLRLTPAHS
jgi:penicillin amidase